MANKTQKPNGRWRVRWEGGSKTVDTKSEAVSLVKKHSGREEERKVERRNDGEAPTHAGMFFGDFVKEIYLPLHAEKKPRSLFKVKYQLDHALPFFEDLRLTDAPKYWERKWEQFKKARLQVVKRSTLLAEFSTLRAVLNEAAEKKMSLTVYCARNPLKAVKFTANVGSVERAPVLRFSEEEIAKICEAAGPQRAAVWTLMVNTGLRRGELLSLERRLCSDDEIEVRHAPEEGLYTKTSTTRYIPLNKDAQKALKTLLRVEPIGPKVVGFLDEHTISRAFTADRKTAGVLTPGTLKTLRKTFISNLVNGAGVPIGVAMELAGHTQMKTTQLYLVGTDDQRKKAVRALEALG